MAVLSNDDYILMPKKVFFDERLSMRDRGVLYTIYNLSEDWDFSIVRLSELVSDGKEAIRTSVNKLEKLGYIKRIKTRDKRGRYHTYVKIFPDI